MGKLDKLLFVVVTILICLSIAWFAHFSKTQMNPAIAKATSQILDGAKADHVELMNARPQRFTLYDACPYGQSSQS